MQNRHAAGRVFEAGAGAHNKVRAGAHKRNMFGILGLGLVLGLELRFEREPIKETCFGGEGLGLKKKYYSIFFMRDVLLLTGLPCLVVRLDHLLRPCCSLIAFTYLHIININYFCLLT